MDFSSMWSSVKVCFTKARSFSASAVKVVDDVAPVAEAIEAIVYPLAVPITIGVVSALNAGNALVQADSVVEAASQAKDVVTVVQSVIKK